MANTVERRAEGGGQPPTPRLWRPAEAQSAKAGGQKTEAASHTPERRAWTRQSTLDHLTMANGRLRPGRAAQIIDLSPGGALIETDWRLLPGTRVELQLGDPVALHRVKGRILRCHVAMLDRERIRYRGALTFEEQLLLSSDETRGNGNDSKSNDGRGNDGPAGSSCTTAGDFRAASQAG